MCVDYSILPGDKKTINTWTPKQGEMIEISDDNEEWGIGKFFAMDGGLFVVRSEDLRDRYFSWKYARPIQHTKEIKLYDEYTATVSRDAVKVGCQTFSAEAVCRVYEAMKEMK